MERNISTAESQDDASAADPVVDDDKQVTDQPRSTYDILSAAISDSEPPNVKYSLSTLWDSADAPVEMPGQGGLKAWPSIKSPDRNPTLLAKSRGRPEELDASHHQLNSQSSRATVRYDSSIEPLSISQQTSASAIRDMGLRKGNPSIIRRDNTEQRPLKSAMKRIDPTEKHVRHDDGRISSLSRQDSYPKDKTRFARFSNFFSRSNSSNERHSSYGRTSSAASQASPNYSRPGLSRQRSVGWDQQLQQFHEAHTVHESSDMSEAVRQAKLADGDIYEKAKTNIRRPPKGIKNWFDGFEISSDEDDLTPVELPSHDAMPSTFTQFRPERNAERAAERAAETDRDRDRDRDMRPARSAKEHRSKAERILGQQTSRVPESFHDRIVPQDNQRRARHAELDDEFDEEMRTPTANAFMQQRHNAFHEPGRVSALSGEISHDEISELAARSSVTDHYSSNNSDIVFSQATPVNMQRPEIPPRQLHSTQPASPYKSTERPGLVSRSSLVSRPSFVSRHSGSKVSPQSHRTEANIDEHGHRKLNSSHNVSHSFSDPPPSRERASTRVSSSHGYDESSGGVALEALSPNSAHMMAVTEDEMALLEMMRNKRAAMQNNNFNEGYRRALQREHEQLMQRRLLAQQTALQILRQKSEQEAYPRPETDDEEAQIMVDDKEIRRLNKLRQEEVNRLHRLEKFLAMDTSVAAALHDTHTSQSQTSASSRDRSIKSGERHSRKTTRTPSFTQQDKYQRFGDAIRADPRSKPRHAELDSAWFPLPPDQDRMLRHYREQLKSNMVSTDGNSAARQAKPHRKSQQSLMKQ